MSTPIPAGAASGQIVQEYAKLVWSTADTLRGAGFKESDWPKFMMPFFALALVESRIVRARDVALKKIEASGVVLDLTIEQDRQDFRAEYETQSVSANGLGAGFHEDLVFFNQGLAHIVQGANPATFAQALRHYLSGFDPDTRRLLGVDYALGEAHYLDIKGIIGQMEGKPNKPLLAYCVKWSEMNLAQFDSSEITMLEEHLKRRWGDISAETSGEQYTPRDLIELVAALAVAHLKRYPKESGIVDIYDPTCGGGNMLFGVEDAMRAATGTNYAINTFGQELNDQLYALAAIEARFRPSATIREGNTLTNDQFAKKQFDIIVANPPYGVDWKDYKKDVEADQSGRFPPLCRPPTSDGQQLFLQHIFHHLKDDGIALVFCSGSTLFSGDAGGGESNSRSHLTLVEDGVHGIIQMPKNEFFNTGINTYLWFFWKNKRQVESLRNRLFFLNAENLFTKLRKSLGSKNSEIAPDQRQEIVDLIGHYETAPGAAKNPSLVEPARGSALLRAVSVDDIHYNKVTLEITRSGEHGALEQPFAIDNATLRLGVAKPFALSSGESVDGFVGKVKEALGSLENPFSGDFKAAERALKEAIKAGTPLVFHAPSVGPEYAWDSEARELIAAGKPLGRAAVEVKLKVAKGKLDAPDSVKISVSVGPDLEKDTETTPFSRNHEANQAAIDGFLAQWVREPFQIIGPPKVGCEINFNRLFPKSVQVRPSSTILAELATLDADLARLTESRKAGVA